MTKQKNIIITGFIGTGKTTVGQDIARIMEREFYDVDMLIEQQAGASIAELFRTRGESHFRDCETQALLSLSRKHTCVIATGGGTLLTPDNMDLAGVSGVIFCLEADPAVLERRLRYSHSRPLVNQDDLGASLRRLLAKRRGAYQRLPHHVDTFGYTPAEVAAHIIDLYLSITRRERT